jgi:mevalonate kinase
MPPERAFFKANGKLMLFGEYVVLRGVPALAFPTKMGQTLEVQRSEVFIWESFESEKQWFRLKFSSELEIIETNIPEVASKLMDILRDIRMANPELLELPSAFKVKANFNRNWGFGSSATLISLLAQWSGMDPYDLNAKHFGGSGYDIACATASTPILYYKQPLQVKPIVLSECVTDRLLFVYLGKKQNSEREVSKFSKINLTQCQVDEFTNLVLSASNAKDIETFENCIDEHERLMSELLKRPTLKELEFSDYPFSIKSLGAWGGDFFMATCRNLDEARMYFILKGKEVVFTWSMLIGENLNP